MNKSFAFAAAALIGTASLLRAVEPAQATVVLAVGAGGNDEYTGTFAEWVGRWKDSANRAQAKLLSLSSDETAPVEKLAALLAAEPKESPEPLWLVMLGHGTSAGGEPKFNLRGQDVSVSRVADWLKPFRRPVVVVCGFATSGAWLKPLAGPDRVVLTATRSASESSFSRFGGYLSQTIGEADADLDQDGQTSLLEAYIAASRKTADWYAQEGRLLTEHALLDDNGDGAGTPADWFKGTRAVKKPKDGKPDGLRAAQLCLVRSKEELSLSPEARKQRDDLELELSALREQKAALSEEEYLEKLEGIFLQLGKLYRAR